MSTTAFLTYLATALLVIITPGLDTMLVLRHVVTGGRRGGMAASVGVSLGSLTWGAASVLGITALLTASQLAYDVLRYAGAGYLIWLGASALWKSRRPAAASSAEVTSAATSAWGSVRAGLLSNLLNPKVGVFYLSLLPQFLPATGDTTGWAALLILTHAGSGLLWLFGVVWLATRAKRLLARERVRRWLDRVTATVLVGLGVKLAFENH
ncbi:LysE family translocator [Allokutzneria sp. NRRL B-24872]|uniref:LysE family translocator n=1 Tax=Allokutzneria sp. NRRL B-24872 TaxID=1137961 RepID=UPI000A3BE107|nr:LysE family translocator [Allokutzneria sp. NRRL B-24872]